MGRLVCIVPDCGDRPRGGADYCNRHRLRIAKYGKPDDTARIVSLKAQIAALDRIGRISFDQQCWEWPGPRNRTGYGVVAPSLARGGSRLAHRVAYEIATGAAISTGVIACHRCDNPACYRPDHLFLGSPADNSRDMVAKGRSPQNRNEKSGRSELNDRQVAEIRARRGQGEALGAIAADFGIHPSHASRICSGARRPTDMPLPSRPVQTHCKRGHDWRETPPYEARRADGRVTRRCRLCQNAKDKARRAAHPRQAVAEGYTITRRGY